MLFAFIFTFVFCETPAVLGVRDNQAEVSQSVSKFGKVFSLRRSDPDNVSDSNPIPGLQVEQQISRSAPFSLLEDVPPPWWTPLSPTRVHTRHVIHKAKAPEESASSWDQYKHVSVQVRYDNLAEEILTFPERRPRLFNAMLATFKTVSADAIVQIYEQKKGMSKTFDWRRCMTFGIFGLMYIGLAQWFLYVSVLTWLFPEAMVFANAPLAMKLQDRTGMADMAGQICIDMLIFMTLIYFPVFYVIKSMLTGSGSFLSRAQAGLTKYRTNFTADNLASCALWIPADVVIFACPMYQRMPMEHLVSFGWTMFMSASRGATEKSEPKSVEKS